MCNFLSAVMAKNKVYTFFGVDSHEDIIQLSGLDDSTSSPDFVRVELLPTKDATMDFTKWKFHVDQDYLPDWWVESVDEKRLVKHVSGLPAITKDVALFSGQAWFCTARVEKMLGFASIALLFGGSQVGEMWGGSRVGKMWGGSQVGEMWDSSQVGEMWGGSRVGKMWGGSQVGEMWDSSQVGEMWGGSHIIQDERVK